MAEARWHENAERLQETAVALQEQHVLEEQQGEVASDPAQTHPG